MQKLPKFSLIMPAYNEELHIREAVESVLQQSEPDFELIAVDDGSQDATRDILRDLAHGDRRIKVLGSTHLGKVAAFNMAASVARGDWFYFIGADDHMPKGALAHWAKAVKHLSPNRPIAARGKMRVTSDLKKYNGLLLPKHHRVKNFSGPLALQSRALLDVVLPIPESLPNEDTWWTLCIQHFAEEIVFSDAVVINYRIHPGNAIARTTNYNEFSCKYGLRQAALSLFKQRFHQELSDEQIEALDKRILLEQMRSDGQTMRIMLMKDVGVRDRLRASVLSSAAIHNVKMRLDRWALGH